jgi:alpha-L-fucosidase 2
MVKNNICFIELIKLQIINKNMRTKSKVIIFVASLILISYACKNESTKSDLILWYNQPAASWNEALPIGNGRLGAMVFGGIGEEHLQLNENTLYSGEPAQNYKNVRITDNFDKVMKLLREEKNAEADEFMRKNWLGRLHANYQPLGDLFFKTNYPGNVTDYRRELNIANSIFRVSYQVDGVKFTREMFASHPDSVIVMKFSASRPVLDLVASFASVHPTAITKAENGVLSIKGQAPGYSSRRTLKQIEGWKDQYKHPELFDSTGKRKFEKQNLYGEEINGLGTWFEAQLKANLHDGEMESDSVSIHVKKCSEVVFVLSAATSFNGFDKSPSKDGLDPEKIANRILDKAGSRSYDELKTAHENDYKQLFDRVSLDLISTIPHDTVPTDRRIVAFAQNNDPEMVELLFQYGRYLMISGSRKGGQPLNLQGIWNDLVIPPWNGGYTININTEMNYWPAEVTNLAECQDPLFRMIREMAVNGSETARLMYNRRGWVAHHNVSIWRETFPNDNNPGASFWNMSAGWLLSHMWEHYLFSGDTEFLKNEAYPLMRGAAMFYSDWLIEDKNGYLVTAASNSPENSFLNSKGEKAQMSSGPTMDMAIVRELFSRTIEAATLLNCDNDLVAELRLKLVKLAPYKIGSKGQIQEWQQDYKEPEPLHRHISHLYGLHPGNQINYYSSPELFRAARQSLLLRGDEATGWSMGWKINMWARLFDGNHAYIIIRNLFKPVGFGEIKSSGGGLYKNMFDACPPFQIDGNFGFTAGVAEMLIQSHGGYIHILPALPEAWPSGEVKGLVARGGFVIDMKWSGGSLQKLTIYSKSGGVCRIKVTGEMTCWETDLTDASGENNNPLLQKPVSVPFVNLSKAILVNLKIPEGKLYELATVAGKTYHFEVRKNAE